jgi:hypothetical protein
LKNELDRQTLMPEIDIEEKELQEMVKRKSIRSKRRYKRAVKLAKRLKRLFWIPRQPGILAKTATPCSCPMCGNRRQYEGPSVSELKRIPMVSDMELEEEAVFCALEMEEQ